MRKLTIADVREHNERAGYYFFSRDTMRFFGTRVVSTLYKNKPFITSDFTGFERNKRRFTVRVYNPETGNVGTAKDKDGNSTFNRFGSLSDAREFARNYKPEFGQE